MIFPTIFTITLFKMAESGMYNTQNATKMFDFYKGKYNRQYSNQQAEASALKNFVINLNKVTSLNEKATDKFHLYQLNRYADLDREYFNNHFGVKMKPYDNVLNVTSGKFLRSEHTKNHPTPVYKTDANLYDLTKAGELYKEYTNTHNNKNYTNQLDSIVHYYRFVKSLVEMNREKIRGYNRPLDENADMLKDPNEYFY